MRRWIAKAFEIPLHELHAAAKAQEAIRRSQSPRAMADDPPASAQTSSLMLPGEPVRYGPNEEADVMMRRQFLQQALSLTATVAYPRLGRPDGDAIRMTDTESFLQQCEANIRACWRLMQGQDMVVVSSVLTSWLPPLDSLLSRPSTVHRRDLAGLASEGYMLGGLVAVLQGQYGRSEWFCQQAVEYAAAAGRPDLTIAALKHLATKYLDAQLPLLTLQTYERAVPLLKDATPLLRGRTHLGLALAHALLGNRADSERQLRLAHETFPDEPERDSAYTYVDARRASLNHYGGLIELQFDRAEQAWETFASALDGPSAAGVPERTVLEIINCQAEAAIALGDVETATAHVETSIQGAARLGSQKRLRDSALLLDQLRALWPGDRRVKRLDEQMRTDAMLREPRPQQ